MTILILYILFITHSYGSLFLTSKSYFKYIPPYFTTVSYLPKSLKFKTKYLIMFVCLAILPTCTPHEYYDWKLEEGFRSFVTHLWSV